MTFAPTRLQGFFRLKIASRGIRIDPGISKEKLAKRAITLSLSLFASERLPGHIAKHVSGGQGHWGITRGP